MAKAHELVLVHVRSGRMTPAEASKLRGLLSWVHRGVTGRPLRGALTALSARQYWEDRAGHALSDNLKVALEYIQLALGVLPPRLILFQHVNTPHKILYTDASTDGPTGLRIGLWLVDRDGPTICSSYDVPGEVEGYFNSVTDFDSIPELCSAPISVSHEISIQSISGAISILGIQYLRFFFDLGFVFRYLVRLRSSRPGA